MKIVNAPGSVYLKHRFQVIGLDAITRKWVIECEIDPVGYNLIVNDVTIWDSNPTPAVHYHVKKGWNSVITSDPGEDDPYSASWPVINEFWSDSEYTVYRDVPRLFAETTRLTGKEALERLIKEAPLVFQNLIEVAKKEAAQQEKEGIRVAKKAEAERLGLKKAAHKEAVERLLEGVRIYSWPSFDKAVTGLDDYEMVDGLRDAYTEAREKGIRAGTLQYKGGAYFISEDGDKYTPRSEEQAPAPEATPTAAVGQEDYAPESPLAAALRGALGEG